MMFAKYDETGYRELSPGIAKKTLVYGDKTLMAKFRLQKGHELPEHSHPHEQTGTLVSGAIRFVVDGEAFSAQAGDSWCIPGDVPHSAEILEDAIVLEVFSPCRRDYIED